jgi:hypothetical protein
VLFVLGREGFFGVLSPWGSVVGHCIVDVLSKNVSTGCSCIHFCLITQWLLLLYAMPLCSSRLLTAVGLAGAAAGSHTWHAAIAWACGGSTVFHTYLLLGSVPLKSLLPPGTCSLGSSTLSLEYLTSPGCWLLLLLLASVLMQLWGFLGHHLRIHVSVGAQLPRCAQSTQCLAM